MSVITCNNTSTISELQWFRFLQAVDCDIQRYYDEDAVIILSAPTSPDQIKSILSDSFIKSRNGFCLFCCDIIINFLFFDKTYVSSKLSQITPEIYHNFLSSNALTIVHCKSAEIFNLPRYIHTLPMTFAEDPTTCTQRSTSSSSSSLEKAEISTMHASEFQVEFMNHPKYYNIIKDCVYYQLTHSFKRHDFRLVDADWSGKQEFYGVFTVGYRCDDGKVVPADIIRQRENKLFIHFGSFDEQSGRKFGWITVPNERISPPPSTAYSRQAHLWRVYNQQRNSITNLNDRNELMNERRNDWELERISAAWTFRNHFCRDFDAKRL